MTGASPIRLMILRGPEQRGQTKGSDSCRWHRAEAQTPVFTALTMPELGPLTVHPNGRRLAYVGAVVRQESWMITNLLCNSK
jgi:hypothetical protein